MVLDTNSIVLLRKATVKKMLIQVCVILEGMDKQQILVANSAVEFGKIVDLNHVGIAPARGKMPSYFAKLFAVDMFMCQRNLLATTLDFTVLWQFISNRPCLQRTGNKLEDTGMISGEHGVKSEVRMIKEYPNRLLGDLGLNQFLIPLQNELIL